MHAQLQPLILLGLFAGCGGDNGSLGSSMYFDPPNNQVAIIKLHD